MKKISIHNKCKRAFVRMLCSFIALIMAVYAIPYSPMTLTVAGIDSSVDGSTGGAITDGGWLNFEDSRYTDAYSAENIGAETTPYIIKNSDELAGLASLVNAGNDFSGKYIDMQGLSATEAAASASYAAATIDLTYFGEISTGGGNSRATWVPAGTPASPFNGNIYSSTGVSIINLKISPSQIAEGQTYFGLFGYIGANGTVGVSGEEISLTFAPASDEDSTPLFSVPSTRTVGGTTSEALDFRCAGGFCAYNAGSISNVTVNGNISVSTSYNTTGNRNATPFTVGAIVANNTGTISYCNYFGDITCNERSNGSAETAENGIGGIAGVSKGDISYCVVSGDITNNADFVIGKSVKLGGIAGCFKGTDRTKLISNCIYSGSITIPNANNSGNAYAGGIAGYKGLGGITRCAASTDIYAYVSSTNSILYIGSIVGFDVSTDTAAGCGISYCFATGSIKTGGTGGGIAGKCSAPMNYCYYTGTLEIIAGKTGDGVGGSSLGGIVGELAGGSTQISNLYFAGSTLSSNNGSIVGYCRDVKSSGKVSKVYYDKQLSPNRFSKSSKNHPKDASAIAAMPQTTSDLCTSLFSSDTTNWITDSTASYYPRLAWTDTVDTSTLYGKLVKALSLVSSEVCLTLGDTNSYTDVNSNRNALQMKSDSITSGVFNASPATTSVTGVTITPGEWSKQREYTGVINSSLELGSVWERSIDITADGVTLKNVHRRMKLLAALTQSQENATSITDLDSLEKYIDICNIASGGYIGGNFYIANDISGEITIQKSFGTTAEDNKRYANVFACTLNGEGSTVNSVKFSSDASSMFGNAEEGRINGVNFTTVSVGTADAPILGDKSNISLFFSTSQNSYISNVEITNATVNIEKTTASNFCFGLMVAYDRKNLSLNNIQIENYDLHIGSYSSTRDSKENIGYVGGLVGIMTTEETVDLRDELVNCDIQNMNAYFDYCQSGNFTHGSGGLVGCITGWASSKNVKDILKDCSVKGDIAGSNGASTSKNVDRFNTGGLVGAIQNMARIASSSFEGNISSAGYVGGIVGWYGNGAPTPLTLTNCFAVGNIASTPANAAMNNSASAGGLVGYMGKDAVFNSSYFTGNITSGYAGGLIGQSNGGNCTVTGSYAKAIITGANSAGGLIGAIVSASNTLSMDASYFAGQVKGSNQSGLISNVPGTYTITNSYFDKQIAGISIPTSAGITASDSDSGSELDSRCAVSSSEITASALGGSIYSAESDTAYPEITAFAGNVDEYISQRSGISVLKVFKSANDEASLTSLPSFTLQQNSDVYSVDRLETADASNALSVWSDILEGPANDALYGAYSPKSKGNTTFTVNYSGYLSESLDTLSMTYAINVKPFDYGSGTENDPYIIYNINELIKYRDYLTNKFDTALQYYKIGEVVNGEVTGNPITLDLSSDTRTDDKWTPIMNLSGHLDGNNSIISNIICNDGYAEKDDNGNTIATYYGLFGSTDLSGNVHNLQLDNVSVSSSVSGSNVGTFIGKSNGGTYENIVVTNASVTLSAANDTAYTGTAGGLIGTASLGGDTQLLINNCFIDAAITKIKGNNSGAGGVVGTVTHSGITTLVNNVEIRNTSAYGSIRGIKYCGGIIGTASCKTLIDSSSSTMDIITSTGIGYIGGILGRYSSDTNSDFIITNSLYGGRIEANYLSNSVGGIVGSIFQTLNINSEDNPFASSETVTITGGESRFATDAELASYIDSLVNARISNCYYNGDTNPYPTLMLSLTAKAYYISNIYGDVGSKNIVYDNSYTPLTGKSYTSDMISSTDMFTAESRPEWIFSADHYPRQKWINDLLADTADTVWDKEYIDSLAQFESLGIFYTNAGSFGDNTFSNIFVTDTASTLNTDSAQAVKTSNGRMLQSIAEGAEATASVSQIIGGSEFTKSINFTPSVTSCGVPDLSFVYANSTGMWITSESASKDSVTYFPFTLYTADQLQGLSVYYDGASNGYYTDGNGLSVPEIPAELQLPVAAGTEEVLLGDQYAMGRSIDAGVYDGAIFIKTVNDVTTGEVDHSRITANIRENFIPIGNTEAFDSGFNGRGYAVENLRLTSVSASKLGLFGTLSSGSQIQKTGVTSGTILTSMITDESGAVHTVLSAGGIAAEMNGSAVINNCFSAVAISGDNCSSDAGGIAGTVSGSGNSVLNSFFSGYIFISGDGSSAGGIAGNAAGLAVRNSYAASYIEAGSCDVICPSASEVSLTSVYYDPSATGVIGNTHHAVNAFPSAASLGGQWGQETGMYPLQVCFAASGTDVLEAAAAVIPVYLTNARSVTRGDVEYPGAQLYYVASNFTGMVQNSEETEYDDVTPFTSFEKGQSGIVMLKVVSQNGKERPLLANLQCWYDAGIANGNNFVINTAEELAEFAMLVNGTLYSSNNPNGLHEHEGQPASFAGCTVKLGANIDMSLLEGNYTSAGTSANPFAGTFDGDGYVISNISVNASGSSSAGLFGYTSGAVITNTGLNGGTVSSESGYAAGIVAEAENTVISGCFSSVTVSGSVAGGITSSQNGGSITNSFNFGELSGTSNVGGIAGTSGGTISHCFNTGNITAQGGTAGGISAGNTGSISDCYQASYVDADTFYAIANGGTVSDCFYDPQIAETAVDAATSQTAGSGDSYTDVIETTDFETVAEFAGTRLVVNGKSYNEFTDLAIRSILADQTTDIKLAQDPDGLFSFENSGEKWSVKSIDSGACNLIASVTVDGITYINKYFVSAVITTKIRYELDFSEVLSADTLNPDRVTGYLSNDTFSTVSDISVITSAADYLSFISYVNGGGITAGKTFMLGANLDLAGQTVSPVGTEAHPFLGTFNGCGYSIDNMTISNTCTSAMFGYIGRSGTAYNFILNNISSTALKGTDDIYLSAIACINEGMISNIGVVGKLVTSNSNYAFDSYIGTLCARNAGKITGCYFIKGSAMYGIDHISKVEDYVGGMVGYNTGSITGCYISSDLRVNTNNIKTLVGNNEGRTDNIINCYFNNELNVPPVYLPYAYDDVTYDGTYVPISMMKSQEFAKWLSSNIYAGTFKQGSAQQIASDASADILNNGFPYLYLTVLSKYDLASVIGDAEKVLLSIKSSSLTDSRYLNGFIKYQTDNYKYFKYDNFSSIITYIRAGDRLRFSMNLYNDTLAYTASTRVYGKNASFMNDVTGSGTPTLEPTGINAVDIPNTQSGVYDLETMSYAGVTKPNLVVITVKISDKEVESIPWGVYRTE